MPDQRANYDLIKAEHDVLRRRIEALEQSDVDIRHVLRCQEASAAETRQLLAHHERELAVLKQKQAEIDAILERFEEHLTGP